MPIVGIEPTIPAFLRMHYESGAVPLSQTGSKNTW